MSQLDLKFNVLPKRILSFLISQYGEGSLLAWNYVGSSVIEGVHKPKDTDIIVLVPDRKDTRLAALPEWIEAGIDYDADYLLRYNASWIGDDTDPVSVVYWDILVMDDKDKYVDWLIATQLAISMNVTDKAARKKLFTAVINMDMIRLEGQQLLSYRLIKRHNELALAGLVVPDAEKTSPHTQDWFFTFGTNSRRAKNFVRVRGTYAEAREKMLATYSMAWAFQYGSMEAAGVEKWGLTEIQLGE